MLNGRSRQLFAFQAMLRPRRTLLGMLLSGSFRFRRWNLQLPFAKVSWLASLKNKIIKKIIHVKRNLS